jgi:hypothetical protein
MRILCKQPEKINQSKYYLEFLMFDVLSEKKNIKRGKTVCKRA